MQNNREKSKEKKKKEETLRRNIKSEEGVRGKKREAK